MTISPATGAFQTLLGVSAISCRLMFSSLPHSPKTCFRRFTGCGSRMLWISVMRSMTKPSNPRPAVTYIGVRRHSVRFCHSSCRIAVGPHCKSRSGLTLLEMLAVIAIIGILASLLLGAVHKAHARAKDRVWRLEAPGFISLIQDRLSRYYQSQISYPAWTADDLYRRHVFDDRIMGFLRSPKVTFIPFSSTDPDDKWILRVVNIWPEEKSPIGLLKTSVTKPE